MSVNGHRLDHLVDVVRDISTPRPLCLHLHGLFAGRNLADQQQIVQATNQGHLATAGLWQRTQDLGDGQAAKPNALRRINVGNVGEQRLDVAHAADDLPHCDLVDHYLAVLFGQSPHALPPLGYLGRQLLVQDHFSLQESLLLPRGRRH